MIWWEKTVEYMFLLTLVRLRVIRIAPLGGAYELAADASMRLDDKYVLIEFKRNREEIPTEVEKYIDGKHEHLKERYKCVEHHTLVYASEGLAGLNLEAMTYFGNKPIKLRKMVSAGIPWQEFKSYVAEIVASKKHCKYKDETIQGIDMSLVAATDQDGNIKDLMSVRDFFKLPDPNPAQEPRRKSGMSNSG